MSKYGNVAGTPPRHTTYRAQVAARSREEAAEDRAQGLETGWTMASYMISGLIGYGLIGWLLAKFTHVQFLFPAGLLLGVVVSVGFVIYRYGRSEKRQDEQAIQGPTAEQAQNSRAGTGRNDR
jgi:F0F1-type ATP synthase assembly protein I